MSRAEDKSAIKRLWHAWTPYIQIASFLGAVAPTAYTAIVFYTSASSAIAAVPEMQKQIVQNQQQIVANKAATDQGIAVLNTKMDMTMDYLGVPHRKVQ